MVFPLATEGVDKGKRAKEEERKERNFRHCRIADLIKSRAANFPRKTELKVKSRWRLGTGKNSLSRK